MADKDEKIDGVRRMGMTPQEMMEDLSKRSGGMPDFAKDILRPHFDVEKADRLGREAAEARKNCQHENIARVDGFKGEADECQDCGQRWKLPLD